MSTGSRFHSNPSTVAAIDIGSSKTACLIVGTGDPQGEGENASVSASRVLGVGYQRSQGIRGGVVFDPRAVEHTIRAAVDKAERQAGSTVDEISIVLNAGRIRSQNYGAALELGGGRVKKSHIHALYRKGWEHIADSSDAILHSLPLGFALDGVAGIENPAGFSGQHLFADFHAVSADLSHVRRVLDCVEDSYLSPVSVIVAPYASALATLRPAERNEGAAVLDLGGGTSSLAVFAGGHFVYAGSLAKGGMQITGALAREFKMPWRDAERLKLGIAPDKNGRSRWPKVDHLVARHLAAIFMHLKKKMQDSGFAFDLVRYIVLTGGGALYRDGPRMAAEIFGKPVRIGVPDAINGMPPRLVNPAFAALCGGVARQKYRHPELSERFVSASGRVRKGPGGRFGDWFQHLTS